MEKKRYYNIDLVKGLLIILVVIGHVVPGELKNTFLRYFIYSFHMPIFIGICGFLFSRKKIENESIKSIAYDYLFRVIVPWIIAVILYTTINNIISKQFSIQSYIYGLIHPYYHLWFILGYISYILITYILVKVKLSNNAILIISLIISVISKYGLPTKGIMSRYIEIIQYDFRLYNLIFFVIGFIIRDLLFGDKLKINKYYKITTLFSIILMVINVVLFFYDTKFILFEKIIFFGLNIVLLISILSFCIANYLPRNSFLEYLGKNSLIFYLYHKFCITFVICIIGNKEIFNYYFFNAVALTLLVLIVYSGNRINCVKSVLSLLNGTIKVKNN